MKSIFILGLGLAWSASGPAFADGSADPVRPKASAAQVGPLAMGSCGLAFQRSKRYSVRTLGAQRIEVSWRHGQELAKLELRFECSGATFDKLAQDAAFRKTDGVWVAQTGAASTPAEVVSTSTWTGVAANSFQGTVCRSVVGKAKSSGVAFFVDFCLPEQTYRRTAAMFDAVEKQLVVQ
jgi:hypothetical protein